MAVEKVSHDTQDADKQDVVVATLDAKGTKGQITEAPEPAALSSKQSLSAYFTIAAAAFGLIRCVLFIFCA